MSNYWEGFICPVCGEGFTLAQWEERHNGKNGEEYHEECCPECKDGTAYDEDEEDDDEDTGLYQCLCEDMVGHIGKCPRCGGQVIPF